jgi:hypothetical protein
MLWFTKDDVAKAADVFIGWFDRVTSATTNTWDDSIALILSGQKENFVNLIAKALNLNSLKAKANGFSAPAPRNHDDMCAYLPGLTRDEHESLTDVQREALVAITQMMSKEPKV